MHTWLQSAITWAGNHETLISWLTAGSVAFYLLTLLAIPWLIIRIPAGYFSNPSRYRSALLGDHPLAITLFKILRNAIGIVFIAVGILLLILPGQGILTIIIGLLIADFPGKHRLVEWLVHRKNVLRSMNWLRRKAGREEIELPVTTTDSFTT